MAALIISLFFLEVTYKLKCKGYLVYGSIQNGNGFFKDLWIDSQSLNISLMQRVNIPEGLLSIISNYLLVRIW